MLDWHGRSDEVRHQRIEENVAQPREGRRRDKDAEALRREEQDHGRLIAERPAAIDEAPAASKEDGESIGRGFLDAWVRYELRRQQQSCRLRRQHAPAVVRTLSEERHHEAGHVRGGRGHGAGRA